ncbi:DNA polymerase III subunit gamma/tau [Aerobium aerolatum]|uniref:DNA polymerase III subunit gamma/tau n=1 Tax=Aquamicrobium aerolatum DSM 21857 TaxID=1121003 RepID=A0A1I3MV32_9HYPH|nr:DNA polymerase III subunit gamma/tau [Aquamicrobium aerolatum]SFJ00873.1 DNA polymerase-3 subunit gamma/tau [Aquamicrobium aerolatum DSM 21857]
MDTSAKDDTGRPAAYRVLARKYRPRDFSGLIGQEPMVRTLTNAFSTGRIAQAWMLTGVRGVGKTTTARILARALNYKSDTTDQPSVDLAIPGVHCEAIMEGRHVDVIEMDAASHTGIDDIREIIEQVRYAPVSARYKVYIIDEVHMLSNQAFNGLLKTLEEPPPHVKFIFATTEIRKVPITILSRCQRFDLRRIDAALIKQHLAHIGELEGVQAEDDALAMIARTAEGSMRDAQSIFDQAIAHSSGQVTAETVRDMLGLADRARIIDLFAMLMKGDVAAALGEYRAQYDAGADPATVLTELADFNHLVTRMRFVPSAADDPSLSQDERTRGLEFSQTLSVRVLSRTWQMLLKGISETQTANRPINAGEMVLIRLAHAASLPTLDEALKMLDGAPVPTGGGAPRPNGGGPAGPSGGPAASAVGSSYMPSGGGGGQTMRLVASQAAPQFEPAAVMAEPAVPEAEPQPTVSVRTIADIVALADSHRDMAMKVMLKQYVRPVRIEDGKLEVALTSDAPKTLLPELNTRMQTWTGRRWVISVSREEGGSTIAEVEAVKRENAMMDARADPAVAAILARFPGSKIIDIRIPDAVAVEDADELTDMLADPGIGDDDDDI